MAGSRWRSTREDKTGMHASCSRSDAQSRTSLPRVYASPVAGIAGTTIAMQSFFCSVLVLLLANTFGHALPFGPDDIYLGPSSLPDDYFDDIPFLTNKQTENIRKTYTGLYDFYQRLVSCQPPVKELGWWDGDLAMRRPWSCSTMGRMR